jgi:hypothetical protein
MAAMRHVRHVGGLLAGILGLLVLTGFGPVPKEASPPILQPAKLGFSYLSSAQFKELWRMAENYAMAEVFLKQCGAPPFIERRMRLASRDCIEARALDRVAAFFRRKVAELAGKHAIVCDAEHTKSLIKATRAKIDAAVEEVRSMCRACLFC